MAQSYRLKGRADMAFAGTPPLVGSVTQPKGRNWKFLFMSGTAIGVVLIGSLAAAKWQSQPSNADEKPSEIGIYSPPPSSGRTYKTGYAEEPKPEPEIKSVLKKEEVKEKPKPTLASGFVGVMAPTINGSGQPQHASYDGYPQAAGLTAPGGNDQQKDMWSGLGDDATQGQSAFKNRWLASAGTNGQDYVTTPYAPPISKSMVQAGTIVKVTTLTAINSDLPGDVVAMVTEGVCDITGKWTVFPPGTKVYGKYSDQLSYGQRRAQIAWSRFLLQDGSSQNIGSMVAVDGSGASGVEGEVDRHSGSTAAAIGGAAVFSILGQAGTLLRGDGGETNVGVVGVEAAGNEASNAGRNLIQRELNRPNTLRVEPGTSLGVMISKDISAPPYHGQGCS